MNEAIDVALRFRKHVAEVLGCDCVLAGGCARDVYYGARPKDWDIIFLRKDYRQLLQGDPIRRRSLLGGKLTDIEGTHGVIFNFYGDKNDRIAFGIKATFEDQEFDILAYETESIHEAVGAFDFNLNQFILSNTTGRAFFVGEYHPDNGLIEVRRDSSEKRKAYIREKYEVLVNGN